MVKSISFLFLIFLLACGGAPSEEKEEVQELELTEGQDSILTPYFEIVGALQNDEFEKARTLGQLLATAVPDTGVKLALTRMGTLMSQSASMYDQRAILEQMGMVITLYIEQEFINDYPIYKFKCKNEFDDKEVVWYGLSKSTANPFIGKNSDECIELEAIIEPVKKQ